MQLIEFTKIYLEVDKEGYLNLLFIDNKKQQHLYFDGIDFYWKKEVKSLQKLSQFNYYNNISGLFINKITQDFDMYFIQISNGDIFQIYRMFNDENEIQSLIIFNETTKNILTPLGISIYEATIKNANQAAEIEIIHS